MRHNRQNHSSLVRMLMIGAATVVATLAVCSVAMSPSQITLVSLFFGKNAGREVAMVVLMCLLVPSAITGTYLGWRSLRDGRLHRCLPCRVFDFTYTTFIMTALCTSLAVGAFVSIKLWQESPAISMIQLLSCQLIFTAATLLYWLSAYIFFVMFGLFMLAVANSALGISTLKQSRSGGFRKQHATSMRS